MPPKPFEIAQWKEATVHPDYYLQFNKKAYSAPHAYVGKKVWVKGTHRAVQIYYQDRLIKQHVITSAYLDRLAHHSHQIFIKEESYRKKMPLK